MAVLKRAMLPVDDNGAVYQGGDMFTLNANNAGVQPPGALGPCFLNTVNFTQPGTAWVISIYDDPAGPVGTPITFGSANPGSYQMFLKFTKGIWIVASGTTPGSITFSYATPITL